jgi:CRISPR-associated protein Csx17
MGSRTSQCRTWQVPARGSKSVARLAPLDTWIERFRGRAGEDKAPAALRRLRKRLDQAILDLCAADSEATRTELVVVLGAIELQLGRSRRWAQEKGVPPLPWLGEGWVPAEPNVEERLALVLAGQGLRRRYSPITDRSRPEWAERDDPGRVWTGGPLTADLVRLALRHDIERAADARDAALRAQAGPHAHLADIAALLAGEIDEDRVAALALGFALIEPQALPRLRRDDGGTLPALYAPLALVCDPRPLPHPSVNGPLPRVPGLLRRGVSGDAEGASVLALRRLRASGAPARAFNHRRLASRDTGIVDTPAMARRVVASLAFPLAESSRGVLAAWSLVRPETLSPEPEP